MKKQLTLLLCIVLLCTIFSSCQNIQDINDIKDVTDEPLRLCVDFGDTTPDDSSERVVLSTIDTIEMYYKAGQGGVEDIELDLIPSSGAEREIMLTQIRTEIMSGEGPDVFISVCPDLSTSKSGLFPFVQKAMAMGYFLPLDDYIEKKAQFIEWDKLEPAVMAAGKYNGQQMVLPMAFDFPSTFYHQEEVSGFDGTTTWNDIITSDDPILAAAAKPVFDGDSEYNQLWFPSVFCQYVDYENDDLLITEEELLQRVKEARTAQRAKRYLKAPKHYSSPVSKFTFGIGERAVTPLPYMNGFSHETSMTMVPVYNTDGGVTVCVRAYCAINRNTVQPNNAFFVVDYLFSEGMFKGSGIYSAWNNESLITNADYVKSKVTGSQREELTRIFDQISCVRFWTPLDNELSDLIIDAVYRATNDEEVEEYVSEAYTKMQMMLAES